MKKYLLILTILGLASLNSYAQQESLSNPVKDSIEVDIDIFVPQYPAEIILKYNIKEFQKNKNIDKYIPAELTYILGDSTEHRKHDIRIKARGNNRRERCSFPPLWINIRKSDVKNVQLEDTKKIKLITHCGGGKVFESYVLKEFLAYKIYNILSPYSFRVRLVSIKYVDTGRKDKVTVSWGVLIEPEAMMADRLNMMAIKNDHVSIQSTDSLWTNIMAVFQYLIGNADYSVEGRHNVKLIRTKDFNKPKLIPIPYDFDYAGIVNAHYAIPGNTLGIESVKERYFLGPCRSVTDYHEILEDFQSKKDEIYQLIDSFEYLSEKERKVTWEYLDEFFNYSDEEYFIQNSFTSTCRKLELK